jgi:FkbM family methyltransferase
VRFVVATTLVKTGASRFFKVKHRDFTLAFDRSGLSKAMWIDPDCRREDHDFMHSFLRQDDTVLDVGANIGTLSLTASRIVGPAGRVFAIEPHPRTFASLTHNIAINARTTISAINVAIGSRSGTLRLSDLVGDDSQNAVLSSDESQGQGIEVQVRRLDELPIGTNPIALLKLDVEGYEMYVLEGAANTLRRTRCIYLEACEGLFSRFGYTCSQLWHLLHDNGFRVFRFEGGRQLVPIPLDFESTRSENFVACRDAREFCFRTGLRVDEN